MTTIAPTMVEASKARNVIRRCATSSATAVCFPARHRRRSSAPSGRTSARILTSFTGSRNTAARARAGDSSLERGRGVRRRRGAGRARRTRHLSRFHRQPLVARRLRNGRVWLLPDAHDGNRARGTARAFRGRADRGRRSRAWNALPPARGPYTGSVSSDRIRLGGMALAKRGARARPAPLGVRGARERRRDQDRIGVKPLLAADTESRFLRGPLKMAQLFALLPVVRRALPDARLPFGRPTWRPRSLGARSSSVCCGRASSLL